MQVFLIPIGGDVYEPYFEAPDEPDDEPVEGRSWFGRLRRRLRDMLREAEAERHRRHESGVRPPVGLMARARRKVMRWIVERAAEQRLLWHLRTATDAPSTRRTTWPAERALAVLKRGLKRDADRHLRLFVVHGLGLLVSVALILVPGPNVLGYFLTFTTVGHLLAWRGAANGLKPVAWQVAPARVRHRTAPGRCPRTRPSASASCHAVAERLGLQHLTTFFARLASLRLRDSLPCVKLRELAERIGAALEGDGAIDVTRVAGIEAGRTRRRHLPGQPQVRCVPRRRTRASAVILDAQAPPAPVRGAARPPIRIWPSRARRRPSRRRATPPPGLHADGGRRRRRGDRATSVAVGPFVVIGRRARIGARTVLHAHVVIGDDAEIGPDCLIHARVSIREACRLGARVVVQDGAVIGADGFGFAHRADGTPREDPAERPGGDRGRRRDRRQHHHRSAGGGRDPDQGRREDRQPGADRPRRDRRPQHADRRAGRHRRQHRHRQRRDPRPARSASAAT